MSRHWVLDPPVSDSVILLGGPHRPPPSPQKAPGKDDPEPLRPPMHDPAPARPPPEHPAPERPPWKDPSARRPPEKDPPRMPTPPHEVD